MTKQADAKRLYAAVDKLCLIAGTETSETVEWLCGPHSGMSKLFEAYFAPDIRVKSFEENHPRNPNAKCKCEHWEACIDCHPTYINKLIKSS